MGQKSIEIVKQSGLNVKELVEKLQSAYADECLAYIQYWEGARIPVGILSKNLADEMTEHATEELEHANLIAKRIMELGATVPVGPKAWLNKSTCGCFEPLDSNVMALLEQNISSERCAIDVYKDLADYTRGKDDITYKLAVKILEEETEHEQDLEDIKNDMETMLD
ncbi:MAG: ferritin [Elusimicrobiaceae bacterium]|nr:ferritin [Elusimicrobiaceae bacterium]